VSLPIAFVKPLADTKAADFTTVSVHRLFAQYGQ